VESQQGTANSVLSTITCVPDSVASERCGACRRTRRGPGSTSTLALLALVRQAQFGGARRARPRIAAETRIHPAERRKKTDRRGYPNSSCGTKKIDGSPRRPEFILRNEEKRRIAAETRIHPAERRKKTDRREFARSRPCVATDRCLAVLGKQLVDGGG
jgi:hypothetical protein